jgi:aryl-alcohol dehydrogenase-like predicted oxidoreductase
MNHLRPRALGAMRLSTEETRDEAGAVAVVHAALDAGVTLLDTADTYGWDETEIGHNERLLRRALESWEGDRSRVVVATKGGLTRPGGRWVPDGRARHLTAACEASRRALGVERIDLYQLHVVDPRTPLATSVRALAALKERGLVAAIGLCNVTLSQIEEARRITEIAAVQVELGPFAEGSFRSGVAEHCVAHGLRLLAHRPLGGAAKRRRLEQDPLLRELAVLHATTPQAIVLAWLEDLSPLIVPLPGPTRVETARQLGHIGRVRLTDEDRARLDARFPAGRLLRIPRARRQPRGEASGEVVLVMGLPGAGKSTLARALVDQGYARLNRDEAGGRLTDLLPALDRLLAAGRRRVVLDNTYATRHSRNAVIEKAWEHGVHARCVWLRTSLEDAQVNAVRRLLAAYGKLLGPEELKAAARSNPAGFGPGAQFRYLRELEPPDPGEGFARIEEVAFEPRPAPAGPNRAVLFWYDGVLRTTRSGDRRPRGPDDVVVPPGRAERLHRCRDEGLLLLGLGWHPELAAGTQTTAEVAAIYTRTHEALGLELGLAYCPHADGPPACWCRKPLPGLGVELVEAHRLDAARCLYVGHDTYDQALAERLGMPYRDQREFFGSGPEA